MMATIPPHISDIYVLKVTLFFFQAEKAEKSMNWLVNYKMIAKNY